MRGLNFKKPIYRCFQCGKRWNPRKYTPKECPKCKSLDWNKPKNKKTTVPFPPTEKITKTTTKVQIGIIPSPTTPLGILPVAGIEHTKEVTKKEETKKD